LSIFVETLNSLGLGNFHLHNCSVVRVAVCNRQDVHSVKRAFNTECIQRHADDHMSVHISVEELNALGTQTDTCVVV